MQKLNDIAVRVTAALILSCAGADGQQFRAFWADAFHYGCRNPAEIEQLLDDVAAAKANVVIAQVRRDGASLYLKSVEPQLDDTAYSKNFDALAYLIERAHARGIEVHAWFTVFPLWRSARPPADPKHLWHSHGPGAADREMWMSVSNTGAVGTSLDPGHPGVLQYLADLLTGVARDYEVDGIHLDYIRYAEDANYGWNRVAVERFNRLKYGSGVPAANNAAWSAFRREQVDALVRQVYLRTMAVKPAITVSAATITWGNGPLNDAGFLGTDAYSRVFQNWTGWLSEGIIDLAIPMNYFREAQFPAYLDRWLNFEKDRQGRRAVAPGLGVYLNSIPESMSQMKRALAPSAGGKLPWGVAFYSYASTNVLNSAGVPLTPNGEFYKSAAEVFGATTPAPRLPWKEKPLLGHIFGRLEVDGGAEWLRDGAEVVIQREGAENGEVRRTDGTGFFGVTDREPGSYFAVLRRGGVELDRSAARSLTAGNTVEFSFYLKESDFANVVPVIETDVSEAAPGEIVTLRGRNFTGNSARAGRMPLPAQLSETQLVVNGAAAPLFEITPDSIRFQMPYDGLADGWRLMVRRDGMESEVVTLSRVRVRPQVIATRTANGTLEVYATGLGLVSPAIAAGAAGPSAEPLPRVTTPLEVRVNGEKVEPLYIGLAPGMVGVYQINVRLAEGQASEPVVIREPDAVSGGPALRQAER